MTDDDAPPAEAAAKALAAEALAMSNAAIDKTLTQLTATAARFEQATESLPGAATGVATPTVEHLDAGLRSVHLMIAQARSQLSAVTAAHEALVASLAERGDLDGDSYKRHREQAVLREQQRRAAQHDLRIADIPDKYALDDGVELDCLERLSLCHARCCHLDHELAEQDLDEGVVRWDYGRPYVIGKDDRNRCVHNEAGRCSIYGARPGSCRRYDCRSDRSIWLDFDNRIIAPRD